MLQVAIFNEVKSNLTGKLTNKHVVQALVISSCSGAVRLSLCSFTATAGCDCLQM